jgi:hypothetical protein
MLMNMGVVSSAGRHPARQMIRLNKAKELELVRKLSPTARHWPDVFIHTSSIIAELNRTVSPIKLANEIVMFGQRLEEILDDNGDQYGIVFIGRKGRRCGFVETIVMSHGHPVIDEDGISLWTMVIMGSRSAMRFQTTCVANISEHALGRWYERGGEVDPRHIGTALINCAKLAQVIHWPSMSKETNEYNLRLGNVLLSGALRSIAAPANSGGKSFINWLFDVRTVFDADDAKPHQLRQAEEIARAIEPIELYALGIVDATQAGPIRGVPVPAGRESVVDKSYEGSVRWREW